MILEPADVAQGRGKHGSAFGRRLRPTSTPHLSVAYADPPYIGVAHRYPEKTEVDHVELIARLERDYPDGWALSAGATSLQYLDSIRPPAARVGAWVKPFYGFKPGVAPGYSWEPLIFVGGRRRPRLEYGPPDHLVANPSLTAHGKQPAHGKVGHVLGRKPVAFWWWLFRLLNIGPGDSFADLFPGSGAGSEAWAAWCESVKGVYDTLPLFAAALE